MSIYYLQGDDESPEKQRSGGYEANRQDKQRQRQYERRRNKVVYGASNSLGIADSEEDPRQEISAIFLYIMSLLIQLYVT